MHWHMHAPSQGPCLTAADRAPAWPVTTEHSCCMLCVAGQLRSGWRLQQQSNKGQAQRPNMHVPMGAQRSREQTCLIRDDEPATGTPAAAAHGRRSLATGKHQLGGRPVASAPLGTCPSASSLTAQQQAVTSHSGTTGRASTTHCTAWWQGLRAPTGLALEGQGAGRQAPQ